MALDGFIFKNFFVRALRDHECDISCETEFSCQSYNYVIGEKSCERNNRTKEARSKHFHSDQVRFYQRRFSNGSMYNLLLYEIRRSTRRPESPVIWSRVADVGRVKVDPA